MVPCFCTPFWYYLFFGRVIMKEELFKKAIIIIYPDGYIDAIDVNKKWDYHYHKAYYDIIKKYSNKIKMYCDETILNREGHNDIDNR